MAIDYLTDVDITFSNTLVPCAVFVTGPPKILIRYDALDHRGQLDLDFLVTTNGGTLPFSDLTPLFTTILENGQTYFSTYSRSLIQLGTKPAAQAGPSRTDLAYYDGAAWKNTYDDGVPGSGSAAPEPPPFPAEPEPWIRPADWLPLPTISPGDQIFAGLFAIFDGNPNYVALMANNAGQIGTVAVSFTGANYAIGDEGYFDDGVGHTTGRYRVTAVNETGGVVSVEVIVQGAGYTASPTDVALTPTTGNGDGNGAVNILTVVGGYTVDWGDGVVEDVAGGVTAEHAYDYSTYDPTDSTLCSRGYKQAVIQVTPQAGSDLTNLEGVGSVGGGETQQAWLDADLNGPELTRFYFSAPLRTYLEHCRIRQNKINPDGSSLFASAVGECGLQSLEIDEFDYAVDCTSLLQYLVNLRFITLPDLPLCTTLYQAFYGCTALEKIVIGDCPLLEDGSYMAEGCSALKVFQIGQAGPIGFEVFPWATIDSMFAGCYALTHVTFGDILSSTFCNNMLFDSAGSPSYISVGEVSDSTTLDFNQLGITNPYLLQYIKLGNFPNMTSLSNMCNSLEGLRIFEMGDAPNCTDFSYAWTYCYSLESWVGGDMSATTTLDNAWYTGYAGLKKLVLGDLPLCTSFYNAFSMPALEELTLGQVQGGSAGGSPVDWGYALDYTYNLRSLTIGEVIGTYFPILLFPQDYMNSAPSLGLQYVTIGDCIDVDNINAFQEGIPALKELHLGDMPSLVDITINQGAALEVITIGATSSLNTFDFSNNSCLREVPLVDSSAIRYAADVLINNNSLRTLPAYDFSSLDAVSTGAGEFVSGCSNLSRSQVHSIHVTHSYANCNLQVPALVEIFENLGTAYLGQPTGFTVNTGGTGYVDGDTVAITGGDGNAVFVVYTNAGAVVVVDPYNPVPRGTGYSVGTYNTTNSAPQSGSGVGFIVNITTVASATITITGNPGTPYLTAAQIAIAEAKGWTVVTS